MANTCFYELKAVSAKKENLERLLKIMKYEDTEYFIYKCFEAEVSDDIIEDNGLYYLVIQGNMAWSCSHWFDNKEDKNMFAVLDYEKDVNGEINYEKPIYGTCHYISIDLLCKKLDIGVELFSQETDNGFQEHYIVNHNGDIMVDEAKDYEMVYYDENNNELAEPYEKGGFDNYGEFIASKMIFSF